MKPKQIKALRESMRMTQQEFAGYLGLVPTGFAEDVLVRASEIDDAARLWDGATTLAALAQKWNGHGREKTEIKTAQMFLEVELGQRLGPNPGAGPGRGKKGSRANLLIPEERVCDLRRFHGHRDMLIEAIRNGKRSRRALLLEVDRKEAEGREVPEVEDLEIERGDFREVLDVEEEAATLILTDPPYPAEYLPLWDDLGSFAGKSLAVGGSLVAYCGQSILPEALQRLSPHLRYWWTFAMLHAHGSQMLPGKYVTVGWKPAVWFVRERRMNNAMLPDRIGGSAPRKTVPTGDDGRRNPAGASVIPILKRVHRQCGSGKQIAKLIGVDHRTVYNWLKGHDYPSSANAAKIERTLLAGG